MKQKYINIGSKISNFTSITTLRERVLSSLYNPLNIAVSELMEIVVRIPVLSEKIKSEILSKNISTKISKIYNADSSIGIICKADDGNDNEPDLTFIDSKTNEVYILEIKVCKKTCSWRGGEFSKREGDHLLVCWNQNSQNLIQLYACVLFLLKADWHSNMNVNYYAPTVNKKDLINKNRIDIVGSFEGYYKIKDRTYSRVEFQDIA